MANKRRDHHAHTIIECGRLKAIGSGLTFDDRFRLNDLADDLLWQADAQRFFTIVFDLYDHTIQVMDTIESFRDVLSGLQDLYLSTLSNRMNEVMKVLTIMATIFIPLTFIAGIYGMNFEYMPELKWPWAYPALWILLIAIFIFMIFWFKRKKWI